MNMSTTSLILLLLGAGVGSTGTTLYKGDTGVCNNCCTGPQGPSGPPGGQGYHGQTGPQGEKGVRGEKGYSGEKGK